MRTLYQASPWKAAEGPVFRSNALGRHTPERLGNPSAFFSRAPFIPTRPVGAPIIGATDRTLILVNEQDDGSSDATAIDMDTVLDRDGWGQGEPVEGVDITRPVCRCHFAGEGSQLGQACSKPTAGGSGSAEFGAGEAAAAGDNNIGTIVVAGAVGVGVLLLLGII